MPFPRRTIFAGQLGLAKSNLCHFGWTVESERNAYRPDPAAGVDLACPDAIEASYVHLTPPRQNNCAGAWNTDLAAMRMAIQLQIFPTGKAGFCKTAHIITAQQNQVRLQRVADFYSPPNEVG